MPDLGLEAPFRAVVILDAAYTSEWQDRASEWLVDQGCRYMMAWGPDCSSWDDSVDWAVIGSGEEDIPDHRFVITSWHENESLEQVMWFAQFWAAFSYDDVPLDDAVLVDVSHQDREAALRQLWESARSLAERDDS